ncbi:MAG: hypothetical protein GYA56_11575 [Geobacteraceae bacterium]|nr:hypothetical protein [Geobacteraceae bacterium]
MKGFTGTGKVEVRGILITRKDGSVRSPYDVVLATWEETDAVLKLWAKSSSTGAGFETCDFRVVFEDGFSYSGTFVLKQQDAFAKNLLSSHIRRMCDTTRKGWDADSFLTKYHIPKAA